MSADEELPSVILEAFSDKLYSGSYIVALDYSTSGLEVGKKISISEELFKRLCGRQDLEGYGVKLGRWVLREEIGEFIGRESEGEGQVEEKRSKR